MHIGLIGGIGPAATDFYYRRLISAFAHNKKELQLTIVHADAPTLLANVTAGNATAQVAIYQRLTERLVAAGAECVVVTSIAGHFCIDAFKQISPLPVIDILVAVNEAVKARGLKRLGLLGARIVMESRFYGGLDSAEVVAPEPNEIDAVHDAYATMAAAGRVTDAQKSVFDRTCTSLLEEAGVEAVMLAGTDLTLVYDEATSDIPVLDCAAVHVEAIVARASS